MMSIGALRASLQLNTKKLNVFEDDLKQTLVSVNDACLKHAGITPSPFVKFTSFTFETPPLTATEDNDFEQSIQETENSQESVSEPTVIQEDLEEDDSHLELDSWRQFVQKQQETAQKLAADRQQAEEELRFLLLEHFKRKRALRIITKAFQTYKANQTYKKNAAAETIQSVWRGWRARKEAQRYIETLEQEQAVSRKEQKQRFEAERNVVLQVNCRLGYPEQDSAECRTISSESKIRQWLPEVCEIPGWSLKESLQAGIHFWKELITEADNSVVTPVAQEMETTLPSDTTMSSGLLSLEDFVRSRYCCHTENIVNLNLEDKRLERLGENLSKLLPSIETLNLDNNQICEVQALVHCQRLTCLSAKGNRLSQVWNIGQALVHLQKLCLSDNTIQFLGEWELPRLVFLDLSKNRIDSLSRTLWKCTNIRRLDLSHNNLTTLGDIPHLTSLTRLDLSHNHFSNLQDLCLCSRLTWLSISNNGLEGPLPTLALPCLTTLYLANNVITTTRSSFFLPSLTLLSLRSNELSSMEEIKELFNLNELDLSFNRLVKMEDLQVLKHLKSLRCLRVTENETYFDLFQVLELIPWLEYFNNEPVSLRVQQLAVKKKISRSPFLLAKLQQRLETSVTGAVDLFPCHLLELLSTENDPDFQSMEELQALSFLISTVLLPWTNNQQVFDRRVSIALSVLLGEKSIREYFIEAAVVIQRHWRVFNCRQKLIVKLQRRKDAARVIQSCWRYYQATKRRNLLIYKKQTTAALTIQDYYRSFHTRKKFREHRNSTKISLEDVFDEGFSFCEGELEWINDVEEYLVETGPTILPLELPASKETVALSDPAMQEWSFKSEDTLNNYYKSRNKQRRQRARRQHQEKMKDPQVRFKEFQAKAKRSGPVKALPKITKAR